MAGENWQTSAPVNRTISAPTRDVQPPAPGSAARPTVEDSIAGASSSTPPPAQADNWATLMARLTEEPWSFDFFQAVRRIECARPDCTPIGSSQRPAQDPVRFGQEPFLTFAPSTLQAFKPGAGGLPPRLLVNFLGFLGPNGPLPLHLTEYARERVRHSGDASMTRFLDLFNHRVISLFYRAWAGSNQAVGFGRGEGDRFSDYFASLIGLGMPSLRNRDAVSDMAKLHFSGRLACQTRHVEGLTAILQEYFGVTCEIEEFIGQWIEVPSESLCKLGASPDTGSLGSTVIVGRRVWDCQQKFRIRMGPMTLRDYQRILPGGESLRRLVAWVRNYVGEEYAWDVQLVLKSDEVPRACLGKSGQIGWTTWMHSKPVEKDQENLVLNPSAAA